jgi:hypothetical protein
MNVFGPGESSFSASHSGPDQNLRSPFQLMLMSRIQCGDGAARTDAEDEEHKPFSHASPSSPCWRLSRRFWILLTHLRQVASCAGMPAAYGPTTSRPPWWQPGATFGTVPTRAAHAASVEPISASVWLGTG